MSYQFTSMDPALVWQHFEDICRIPHGSGNEEALAIFIENFAQNQGLFCHRDTANNVFVRLPATKGYEHIPPVMLQGHTDMVCEKDSNSTHDFAKDALSLFLDGDKIAAQGTTLGGDDGIAVAMMMAVLQDPPQPHPTIECLFTVSEETGLEGAHAFDPSAVSVTAKTMINLDSECESVVTAGCAGGMRTDITLPVVSTAFEGICVEISLDGFSGGHSGVEIHEGHTNAIKALGEILTQALQKTPCPIYLCDVHGGGKDNAIPREAHAILALQSQDMTVAEQFCNQVKACAELLRQTPHIIPRDHHFTCRADIISHHPQAMFAEETNAVLALWQMARDGVLAMNAHVKGMVAYSRNMGILQTIKDEADCPTGVRFSFSTRSACETHLDSAERELELLAKTCSPKGTKPIVHHHARYPGWDYAPTSPIRELWLATSQNLYGNTPKIEAIHAGLECGILLSKMPGMDIISVGPDMWDIHTPKERLGISSTARLYRLLREVLQKYCHM